MNNNRTCKWQFNFPGLLEAFLMLKKYKKNSINKAFSSPGKWNCHLLGFFPFIFNLGQGEVQLCYFIFYWLLFSPLTYQERKWSRFMYNKLRFKSRFNFFFDRRNFFLMINVGNRKIARINLWLLKSQSCVRKVSWVNNMKVSLNNFLFR